MSGASAIASFLSLILGKVYRFDDAPSVSKTTMCAFARKRLMGLAPDRCESYGDGDW